MYVISFCLCTKLTRCPKHMLGTVLADINVYCLSLSLFIWPWGNGNAHTELLVTAVFHPDCLACMLAPACKILGRQISAWKVVLNRHHPIPIMKWMSPQRHLCLLKSCSIIQDSFIKVLSEVYNTSLFSVPWTFQILLPFKYVLESQIQSSTYDVFNTD